MYTASGRQPLTQHNSSSSSSTSLLSNHLQQLPPLLVSSSSLARVDTFPFHGSLGASSSSSSAAAAAALLAGAHMTAKRQKSLSELDRSSTGGIALLSEDLSSINSNNNYISNNNNANTPVSNKTLVMTSSSRTSHSASTHHTSSSSNSGGAMRSGRKLSGLGPFETPANVNNVSPQSWSIAHAFWRLGDEFANSANGKRGGLTEAQRQAIRQSMSSSTCSTEGKEAIAESVLRTLRFSAENFIQQFDECVEEEASNDGAHASTAPATGLNAALEEATKEHEVHVKEEGGGSQRIIAYHPTLQKMATSTTAGSDTETEDMDVDAEEEDDVNDVADNDDDEENNSSNKNNYNASIHSNSPNKQQQQRRRSKIAQKQSAMTAAIEAAATHLPSSTSVSAAISAFPPLRSSLSAN